MSATPYGDLISGTNLWKSLLSLCLCLSLGTLKHEKETKMNPRNAIDLFICYSVYIFWLIRLKNEKVTHFFVFGITLLPY